MGPRRQFVGGCLEDNPEGSATSISAVATVSTQRVSRRRSQIKEGERQGSRPSTSWQRFWEDERFQHRSGKAFRCRSQVSNFVSESRRTSCSSSASSDEVRNCHPSCRRGRSCSSGIEGGIAENPHPSAVAAGPRPDKSHRGISESVPEEVGDHDVRSTKIKRGHHRIRVENPGWRTPIGWIKNRSQRSAVSICHCNCNRSSGGDPSASCKGWVFETTANVGQFVPRVGAFGCNDTRWGVDGLSHPSSRRIHEERMNIFKFLRDAE